MGVRGRRPCSTPCAPRATATSTTRRAARCSAATTRTSPRPSPRPPRGRRLRGRARRPGRAVRTRVRRGGLRRGRPPPARTAGGAARGGARDRHPGRAGAAGRPALRHLARRSTGSPPWCAGSSPARRARPALADVLSGRAGPVRPAAGQLPRRRRQPARRPTWPRRSAGRNEVSNIDPTPLFRVRARAVLRLRRLGRRRRRVAEPAWPTDGVLRGRRAGAQHRRPRPRTRSCRSTCTTRWPRWPARSSS